DLARVLVIVRPMPVEEPAPEPEPEPTLGAFFMERVAGAWRSGLEGLVRTIAAILEALVAGLLWWMIFAVIVIVVVRKLRRPAGMPGRLTT
ncbi:MAG: hypothetical protein KDA21_15280, partial [Phycisphaerales bacterium]|nr:hypothetical protein [Phycisphaerales bacterium]